MSDDKPEWAKRNDEIHKGLMEAGDALKEKDTPLSVEDLADPVPGIAQAEEERLVRNLFDRIREAEIEVHDSQFVMDAEDLEPGTMDTSTERAHRIDAEGEQLNDDHIYDAIEAAERAGGRIDSGWEWWSHPCQLNHLRRTEDFAIEPLVERDFEEEFDAKLHGAGWRLFPQFPRAAVLLLDPEVLVPEHGVGSRVPQGVVIRDPRKVVRITSLSL